MKRLELSKKGAASILAVTATLAIVGIWALRPPKPGASTRSARKIVAALRAMPVSPLRFDAPDAVPPSSGRPTAEVAIREEHHPANVTLPERSTEPLRVEDATTGMVIDIQPRNVFNVVAQSADGYYVYPNAHASGGTLLHRLLEDGTGAEDFVSFETRPAVPEVQYALTLDKGVGGLRLVEGQLELLDDLGTPRLRAAPPFLIGADGVRTDATLVVEGCAVDTDPAAPWGRDLVAPGGETCTLRVRWNDERVTYPAVLDPRWTSTQNMTAARQDFTATLMSTGKVLAVGGRASGSSTTGLTSAEVYDPVSKTWATTSPIPGGRYLHTAIQLATSSNGTTSGKVYVAGGANAGSSLNTAQLYSPSAGTWTAATNLPASRNSQTATLLTNGKVLLAGGVSGTTVLNTAVVYDPSSGTGTLTATGSMPQAVKLHSATLLKIASNTTLNNKVLVVGGNSGSASVTKIQLFDGTSTWSSLSPLSSAREGHTATALANGNVLIAGGRSGSTTLNTTFLFNAASGSGTWSSAGNLTAARQLHTATLLPATVVENGQVLIAGGSSGTASLSSAEVWNGTSTWTATTPLLSAVQGQTATLLANNLVLLAGGANGSTTLSTAVLFDGSFALSCTSNSQCATGFCVSGVCCDTACNGGCGVCNLPGKVGTCSAASTGTVCRAQSGACDVAETCNGTSLACPPDGFAASTTVCRASAGSCDVAEKCTGTSASCPADGFVSTGTVCRASTGTCDVAETCTGTSASCPADGLVPTGTVCRASTGACDVAETCTGTSASCPADGFVPTGTVCRASTGTCDVAETCSGSSAACPTDGFAPSATVCRPSAGACDVAETCTGTSASCPADGFVPTGTVCRASTGTCDVAETCSGSSAACPTDGFAPSATVCRPSAGACDVAETCTGISGTCPADGFVATGTVCRASTGTCDVAETCSGSSAACPTDGFAPPTTVCRAAAGPCDAAEQCTGSSASCPADGFVSSGTVCRASAGPCDVAEVCSGASTICAADAWASSGTVCRPANGPCDLPESCTGASVACPTDNKVANDTICDDGNACTQGETCQGGTCLVNSQTPTILNLPVDDLGTLGGTYLLPSAINGSQTIVGTGVTASGQYHAFAESLIGSPVDLNPAIFQASAYEINSAGNIVGSFVADDGLTHAFQYTSGGGMTDIGLIGDGSAATQYFAGSDALDINDSGQIVGTDTNAGILHGFRLSPGGGAEDIGSLLGAMTWAQTINDAGDVFGTSQLPDTPAWPAGGFDSWGHAFVFSNSATGMVDLNTYVDPTAGWTAGRLLKARGDYAIGGAQIGGQTRGFRYRVSSHVLEEIPVGWPGEVFAGDVNRAGDTVGLAALDAANTQVTAFLYSDRLGLKNLNDVIDQSSGWHLVQGTAINDAGDIVGTGTHNGVSRAFHLRLPSSQELAQQSICQGDVMPALAGIAVNSSGATEAVFTYTTSAATVTIPYGSANNLADQNGLIRSPPVGPPTTFVSAPHAPFVVPLSGTSLTWNLDGHSVTATASSNHLPTVPLGDGTSDATLLDGSRVNLDSTPPASPALSAEPAVGGQYFGTLKGSVGVSPSGAATYTVPISIPPGVAGMAPSLNLTYNSQGKDGIAGQGWDLSGTSMIHRCPLSKVQDGIAQPVTVQNIDATVTDGVCLDGKRLFRVSENVYKLESEDFSTITKFTSGSDWTFKIATKAGQTRYYGLSSKTQVALPDAGNVTSVSIWLLERVVDQWGNYYDLHYDNDDPTRFPFDGAYLTSINYTGHLTSIPGDPSLPSFTGTTVSPPNTITFAYEYRPDPRIVRFHYGTLQLERRLTGITTPQGTYALTYLANDPLLPSRLDTIRYCNGPTSLSVPQSTECLEPLQFGWDAGGYSWPPEADPTVDQTLSYALPVSLNMHLANGAYVANGIQFVDLDGDGRVDLLEQRPANSGASYDSAYHAWWNNGKGWTAKDEWSPAQNLVDGNGKVASFIADVDGDGIADVISMTAQGKPTIRYNRIKTGGLWAPDAGPLTTSFPQSWGALHFHVDDPTSTPLDSVVDIDGDGRADIVRQWPNSAGEIDVLLNTPSGWTPVDYSIPGNLEAPASDYWHFTDVNRDGLPDLVNNGGAVGASTALINMGLSASNPITHTHWQLSGGTVTLPSFDPYQQHIADIDGDGYYDIVEDNRVPNGQPVEPRIGPAVVYGTGTGYTEYMMYPFGQSAGFYGGYASSLVPFTPALGADFFSIADINGDGLVDAIINSSFVLGKPWGQLLINAGPGNGWVDPSGDKGPAGAPNTFSLPYVPYPSAPNSGDAWVDLNGDGLVDIVHSSDGGGIDPPVTQAWVNRFRRPIITQFPAGLAAATTVSYKTITTIDAKTSGVYDDSASLDPNTTYMATPLRVVESTISDAGLRSDGGGITVVTRYRYEALRGSAFGRGAQGFKSVTVTDPVGTVTTTTYAQAYPYTGLPVSVKRSYDVGDGLPLGCQHDQDCPANSTCQDGLCRLPPLEYSRTVTSYCAYQISADTSGGANPPCVSQAGAPVAPGTSLFVYPSTVEDVTTLETGTSADRTASNPTTDVLTTNVYDHHGNPTTVKVVTTVHGSTAHCPPPMTNCSPADESYSSTTVNVYDSEGSDKQLQGKVTQTTVTTQQTAPVVQEARRHVSTFGYQPASRFCAIDGNGTDCNHATFALNSKQAEPGAGYPFELDTTYSYDPYGNVTTTTVCDNGVGGCRTTTVSYDPGDFVAPQGSGLISSISYQPGLFPVLQSNAMGHKEYFVYDPVFGQLLQHTGPNGISDCNSYDSFGNRTSETARCGSSPVVTTTARYWARGVFAPIPSAATVTVVRPATGAVTWTYTDAFGRTVDTLARNLNGTLTQMLTTYDPMGRLYSRTQPALPGDLFTSTTFLYDSLNRLSQTNASLGDIDGTGNNTVAITLTSYQGASVTTRQTVHGGPQQRTEMKNALGKLAWAVDNLGNVVQYRYDSEGNLTDVLDPSGNDVHTHYDSLGRKDSTTDPDMGTWQYCYDGFGDLVGQIDAKNPGRTCATGPLTLAMTYDALGRMTSRTEVATGDTAQWKYDALPGAVPGAGVGKLVAMVSEPNGAFNGSCAIPNGFTVTGGDRAVKTFQFDQFGNTQEIDECADGTTFATTFQYDALGRQSVVRYPAVHASQLAVGYHYSNTGALQYLTDDSTDYAVLWQAKAVNGLGQVVDEQMRNGVETVAVQNGATGWTMSSASKAHANGDMLIQQWSNTYDEAGNLRTRSRTDAVNDFPSNETFGYDGLNRLTSSQVQLPTLTPAAYDHTDNFGYDALGNLTSRNNGINTYGTGCVGAAGPHAICTIAGGPGYTYDENGNLTNGGGRAVIYNAANKPTAIVDEYPSQTGNVQFAYGADRNRVLQVATNSQGTSRTVYVGLGETGKSLYERTTVGGAFLHTFFMYASGANGGNAFAVRVLDDNGHATNSYFNFDHLGSTTAVSDDQGRVTSVASAGPSAGVLGYDPWGARRDPDGQPGDPSTFALQPGHREFTGHEAIPTVGLVNMNGRVYDPVVGRFLSPDPNVQSPNDLQSYNRYSYVFNNPLRYTDPTGYFSVSGALPGILIGLVTIGACVAVPGVGCVVATVITTLANVEVARGEGASWGQIALTTGIGLAAGTLGGAAGGFLGGALGAAPGSSAEFAANLVGGAVGGALGGALSTAAAGGGLGTNVLTGALQGAVWAAVGWGSKQGTPLAEGDAGQADGGSGASHLERLATTSASDGSDDSGMIPASLRDDAEDLVQGARDRLSCALSAACRQAVRNAMGVDLATDEGKAVFWSGGARAEQAADSYADQTGGYTIRMKLESTSRGSALLDQIDGLPTEQQRDVWRIASARFALGASGDVQVFISPQASPRSLFFQVEEPILNVKQFFGTAQLNYNLTPDLPLPQSGQSI